jgi:hypothetical protein
MNRFFVPLALLLYLLQRTVFVQVPEVAEIALMGAALFGLAAAFRRPRPTTHRVTRALFLAHSTSRMPAGAPGARHAA